MLLIGDILLVGGVGLLVSILTINITVVTFWVPWRDRLGLFKWSMKMVVFVRRTLYPLS